MKLVTRDNVSQMQSRRLSGVITMPSRDAKPAASSVLLKMPPQIDREPANSGVVVLPARAEKAESITLLRSGAGVLSLSVRMALMALIALLGPHPTRDNDPGPSAARPGFWERLSLISRQELSPAAAHTASAVIPFHAAEAEQDGYAALAA